MVNFIKQRLFLIIGFLTLLVLIPTSFWLIKNIIVNSKPTTYSTIRFSSKNIYILAPGDILTGKGMPNSKINLTISPNKVTANLTANQKGDWSYRLPKDLTNGTYRVTLLLQDSTSQLADMKSFQIKVKNRNFLQDLFKIKSAAAQDATQNIYGNPDFQRWQSYMETCFQTLALVENGEIVLYDKAQYETEHPGAFIRPPRATGDVLTCNLKASSQDFFAALIKKLYENKYYPVDVLTPYVPGIEEYLQNNLQNQDYMWSRSKIEMAFYMELATQWKDTIDEATLNQYILDITRMPNSYGKGFDFFEATNPIFGLKSWGKILTMQPASTEEMLDVAFSIGVLKGLGTAGIKAVSFTSDMVIDSAKMIKEAAVFRNSLKQGERLPLAVVEEQATKQWIPKMRIVFWDNPLIDAKLIPQPLFYNSLELQQLGKTFLLIKAGKAAAIKSDIAKGALRELWASKGKDIVEWSGGKVSYDDLLEILDRNLAIMIKDEEYTALLGGNSAGCTYGRVVFLREGELEADIVKTIKHELAHVANYKSMGQNVSPIGRVLKFQEISRKITTEEQANQLAKILGLLHEFGTDWVSGGSAYCSVYPQICKSLGTLIDFLAKKSGGSFSWNDLGEFAITGDAQKLLDKILSFRFPNQIEPQNLLLLISEKLDFKKLDSILGYAAQREAERLKVLKIAAGGVEGALTIGGFFTAIAHGEELPPDTVIVYPPPDYGEDINLLKDDSGQYKIIIDSVSGEAIAGGKLSVSAIVSTQDGTSVPNEEFRETWILDSETQPLPGGKDCPGTCPVTLPQDLTPGSHKITANLTKAGSDTILASDTYELNSEPQAEPTPIPVTVSSVTFDDQTFDAVNFQYSFGYNLKGEEGKPETIEVPVTINYSDGTFAHTALSFDYQPEAQ